MMNEACRLIQGCPGIRVFPVAMHIVRLMLDTHGFSLEKCGFCDDHSYFIQVNKPGSTYHVEGIDFRYCISLTPEGSSDLRVTVQQEDIREQMKAQGIDYAIGFQVLTASDAGWMVTSAFAQLLLDELEGYVGDIMARSHA